MVDGLRNHDLYSTISFRSKDSAMTSLKFKVKQRANNIGVCFQQINQKIGAFDVTYYHMLEVFELLLLFHIHQSQQIGLDLYTV